jgi:hypothetical protein
MRKRKNREHVPIPKKRNRAQPWAYCPKETPSSGSTSTFTSPRDEHRQSRPSSSRRERTDQDQIVPRVVIGDERVQSEHHECRR